MADDILSARFFAPKITDVAVKPQDIKLGWRKVVRLRARTGSQAQAKGLASAWLLFNVFSNDVQPFNTKSAKAEYRQGRKVATVNRALGVLRAAINWGRFQDPPLLSTTPFDRFGVTIKARDETKPNGTGVSTATVSSDSWPRA